MFYVHITKYTAIFVEKMREASHIFFNKNIGVLEILTFEMLTNDVVSFEQSDPGEYTRLKS